MNQFGLERKAELIEYINEDFSKIKDYDFNNTLSCGFVDLCILLTILCSKCTKLTFVKFP